MRSIVHLSWPRGSHVLRAVRLAGELRKNRRTRADPLAAPVCNLVSVLSRRSRTRGAARTRIRKESRSISESSSACDCRRRVRRHSSMSVRELRQLDTAAELNTAGRTRSKSIRDPSDYKFKSAKVSLRSSFLIIHHGELLPSSAIFESPAEEA